MSCMSAILKESKGLCLQIWFQFVFECFSTCALSYGFCQLNWKKSPLFLMAERMLAKITVHSIIVYHQNLYNLTVTKTAILKLSCIGLQTQQNGHISVTWLWFPLRYCYKNVCQFFASMSDTDHKWCCGLDDGAKG